VTRNDNPSSLLTQLNVDAEVSVLSPPLKMSIVGRKPHSPPSNVPSTSMSQSQDDKFENVACVEMKRSHANILFCKFCLKKLFANILDFL
jgi:hypothetical protein